ncbi:MAG: CHASE2 domain-containing protein [Zoogloeaceae bacterium]|jgi:CHASE2 domain-containing sensor protein/nitrogen-specific signal transduction histidine kinase|nr:CHASE2 domain-containing protein [Zoogloeaceae bacterium]
MRLPRRIIGEWLLLTLVLVFLGVLVSWQGWFWRADQTLYDTGLTLSSRPVPDGIVIVAIDEKSLRRIGHWPWRRAIHASLIEKLTAAGASAVGLDIIFNEASPNETDDDHVLADAIWRNGRVVLPVVPRALASDIIEDGVPIGLLRNAAAELGHMEIQHDADGIVRNIYLWGGTKEPLYPQFALALLKVGLGDMPSRAIRTPDDQLANGTWKRDVWVHPQFAGPPGTYQTVSYADVLSGAVGAQELKGKYILVGATAAGLGDQYPTPVSEFGVNMPGIEIHATLLDDLRTNTFIVWLPPVTVAAITMFAITGMMLGLLLLSPRNGLLFSAICVAVCTLGVILLLHWGKFWLPPSGMLLGTLLAYPLWSWRRLELVQRSIDAELAELHEDDPTTIFETASSDSVDPLENRVTIVRAATLRQRMVRKARQDTIRFISHDIRGPLASIILLTEGHGDEANDHLRRVKHYARRALDLIDEFSDLIQAEILEPRKFGEVDLAALMQEAADNAWTEAQHKQIEIVIHHEMDDEAIVRGDRGQLVRAIDNLLSNAIKFSPQANKVELVLRRIGDSFEIAVTDQGRGIATQDMDKLFTRYSRIGTLDTPGLGLGLLIVKTIVEGHGGKIDVESHPEAGSTFRMTLPAALPPPYMEN